MDDSWLQTLVGGLIGFGAGVFTDPVKALFFHPVIDFQKGVFTGCLLETKEYDGIHGSVKPAEPHDAMYYRVRLTKTGRAIARSVRLYLTAIESSDLHGHWGNTGFADTLMLPWSCRGDSKFLPIDLPRGIPHFADLMSTREPEPNALRMEVDGWPLRYAGLLAPRNAYRLTILATGDNFEPVSTKVGIAWNGSWKDLRMTSGNEKQDA